MTPSLVTDGIRELEQELVPEWRAKYLDYKVGKKKVKAIARALQKANRTSLPQRPTSSPGATAATSAPAAVPSHHRPSPALTSDHAAIPPTPNRPASAIPSEKRPHSTDPTQSTNQNYPTPPAARAGGSAHTPNHKPTSSLSRSTPVPRPERHPLHTPSSRFSGPVGAYGSIIASPPGRESTASDIASLELPDPALDPQDESPHGGARNEAKKTAFRDRGLQPKSTRSVRLESPPLSPRQASFVGSPGANSSIARRDFEASSPDASSAKRKPQLLKRVFTHQDWELDKHAHGEVPLLESELRRDEFFVFLDDELDKIESFYQMKEEEASRRLQLLRRQLHIMRDRRVQDILAGAKKTKQSGKTGGAAESKGLAKFNSHRIRDVFTGRSNRLGKDTEALAQMASTPGTLRGRDPETVTRRRDFSRRPDEEGDVPTSDVSYRSAKRKLKHALQEFYRGLELLKGYAYLNRTAFRKINKKYDKTVQARPAMRYMSEKVNKAWFVQSEVTESLIAATEDLYARYFERGNRKLTISKLRQHDKKAGDYSSNTFRSGLLLMAGLLFAIQALIYVGQHMSSKDEVLHVRTSYLLQIYGGFFLVVFHFLLFCLVCMIWAKSKINYVFIFEFDIRHALEWRQLLELPSFFFFLLGLFMWLNFFIVNDMYIYWPVVLVGLTLIILFLPARVLYHRSRQWWAYSNWRLVLAGLYPVEFRDFFLGDMYCSQAYSMGNIALFFCLYAKHWSDPPQCNSSHSRLLGFFQCLPAVWRAFQCLRRYGDTRNVFPHLMNFGKYIFSVMYYATLSMYRIRRETRFQATFITFALLNAVYTSVWDLAMDWSLGNPYAKNPLLREVLAFRRAWVYYVAMVLDVVVRFNWIFYAIFANDVQHSAVLSFVVSFSEVCRRGLWTVFRVENEHCTNVLLFRASRDVPLPYELPKPHDETTGDHHPPDTQLAEQQQQQQQQEQQQEQSPTAISTAISQPTDVEQGPQPPTPAGASVRSRRASRAAAGISRVGSIVAAAHAQDFERRKRPEMDPDSAVPENDQGLGDTTDEDEDDSGDGDGDGDEDADGDGSGNADGRGPDEGTYADDLPSTRARISEERV